MAQWAVTASDRDRNWTMKQYADAHPAGVRL